MNNIETLNKVSCYMDESNEIIAVAESVTTENMQTALSFADNATQFF